MKDIPTYLNDPYKRKLRTLIVKLEHLENSRIEIILEDTVFYPAGGGQPCDQGTITNKDSKVEINEVRYVDGEIVHRGLLKEGELNIGENVDCEIDWNRRYKNMLVHTAGHAIDELLFRLKLSPDRLKPQKASHGSKAYIMYKVIDEDIDINTHLDIDKLNSKLKEFLSNDIDITWDFISNKKELKKQSRFTTAHIPEHKPLRIVKFGDEKGIPDGGTMVKNTSELPEVLITELEQDKDILKVNYKVNISEDSEENEVNQKVHKNTDQSFPEIKKINEMLENDFSKDSDAKYSELKSKYLGKKGLVKDLLRSIGDKDPEVRADFGKEANILKNQVDQELQNYKQRAQRKRVGETLTEEAIDVTARFDVNTPKDKRPELISKPGTLHPITQIGEKALEVFRTMGFHVTEARRLDSDYNVFEALNLPKGHPARDMWDTFWTEDGLIPITHTSAMQNRLISGKKVPIREVIVGRCFRNEATDASHEHTFYQVEGIYVDEDVKLSDLIGTLSSFMNEFYGQEVEYRIQPSYFPFVEPGLEFMIECLVCGQKGCPFCGYSGWVEVIPCGMIHPNVLKAAGRDPDKYSGFAWGLGYDRLVMLGSKIQDIRNIHSGNLKFLEQFK